MVILHVLYPPVLEEEETPRGRGCKNAGALTTQVLSLLSLYETFTYTELRKALWDSSCLLQSLPSPTKPFLSLRKHV